MYVKEFTYNSTVKIVQLLIVRVRLVREKCSQENVTTVQTR